MLETNTLTLAYLAIVVVTKKFNNCNVLSEQCIFLFLKNRDYYFCKYVQPSLTFASKERAPQVEQTSSCNQCFANFYQFIKICCCKCGFLTDKNATIFMLINSCKNIIGVLFLITEFTAYGSKNNNFYRIYEFQLKT